MVLGCYIEQVALLNALEVFKQGSFCKRHGISDSQLVLIHCAEERCVEGLQDRGEIRLFERLPVEKIRYGLHRLDLVGLLRVELEFHSVAGLSAEV